MSTEFTGKCWNCERPLTPADYGRECNCLGCGKPARVCRNCRNYARGRPNDCVEPMADPILDKERANFCGYFEPTDQPAVGSGPVADDLLEAAKDLFK